MRVLCDKCDKVCNLKRAIKSNKFVCWSCKNDKEKENAKCEMQKVKVKNAEVRSEQGKRNAVKSKK